MTDCPPYDTDNDGDCHLCSGLPSGCLHDSNALEFGRLFRRLVSEQAEWSQKAFGSDDKRGPIGALKHLEKEAVEAQDSPSDIVEYADCLLLIVDASRRAGFNPHQLVEAAYEKLQVCKSREWPTPTSDEPVEHIRGE